MVCVVDRTILPSLVVGVSQDQLRLIPAVGHSTKSDLRTEPFPRVAQLRLCNELACRAQTSPLWQRQQAMLNSYSGAECLGSLIR